MTGTLDERESGDRSRLRQATEQPRDLTHGLEGLADVGVGVRAIGDHDIHEPLRSHGDTAGRVALLDIPARPGAEGNLTVKRPVEHQVSGGALLRVQLDAGRDDEHVHLDVLQLAELEVLGVRLDGRDDRLHRLGAVALLDVGDDALECEYCRALLLAVSGAHLLVEKTKLRRVDALRRGGGSGLLAGDDETVAHGYFLSNCPKFLAELWSVLLGTAKLTLWAVL